MNLLYPPQPGWHLTMWKQQWPISLVGSTWLSTVNVTHLPFWSYCSLCPAPTGTYDLRICCNGVLSGLVMVTSMCGFIDPWAAVVCGCIAGAAYPCSSLLLVSRVECLVCSPSCS